MTNTHELTTYKNKLRSLAAIVSGISLVIMTLAAFFAFGYAHDTLVVYTDPDATLANLLRNTNLFGAEITAWGIIVITDFLVTWGFYVYLKPEHNKYALASTGLRLIYTLVLSYAVMQLISAYSAVSAITGSPLISTAGIIMSQIIQFDTIWSLGLIVFGGHLIFTGLAAKSSSAIPKTISYLLVIAGASYILIHTIDNFAPAFSSLKSTLELILMLPMVVGELGFGLWLLIKGRKV